MNIRDAKLSEIGQLAKIWFDGWQDAHAQIVPAELARHRTLESFGERLRALIAGVRVVGPADAPVGFYMLKGDELKPRGLNLPADVAAPRLQNRRDNLSS